MGFKPGVLRQFVASARFQEQLDAGNIPGGLEEEFEDEGSELTDSAHVVVNEQGVRWTIKDGSAEYPVVKEKDRLTVYTDDFEGSLAAEIETEFEDVWTEVKGTELPDEGRRDRRILFVAVARGVIKYLKKNADEGFDVEAESVQKDDSRITSSGSIDIPGYGQIDITVQQEAGDDNRVESDIEPGDVEIEINAEGLDS